MMTELLYDTLERATLRAEELNNRRTLSCMRLGAFVVECRNDGRRYFAVTWRAHQ